MTDPTKKDLSDTAKLAPASELGWLHALLEHLATERASDLHIVAEEAPRMRRGGQLEPLTAFSPMASEAIEVSVQRMAPAPVRERLEDGEEVDFSYTHDGNRFRVSAFAERRGMALAIRRLASKPQTLAELRLPQDLARAAYFRSGLVLISGHAGSGKTTTMFGLVQELCAQRTVHVVTLEDPIEIKVSPKQAYLEQRELGRHFRTFREGVDDVLRASPDIMVIGELRDSATIRAALLAAETGLLVFSTVHAYDTTRTITRIVNSFSLDEQREARVTLAYTLRMVVAQTLLQDATREGGRRPAVEVCLGCTALANLVRERKEHEITTLIESSRSRGMRTLDQDLVALAQQRLVSKEEVLFRAVRKENVERILGRGN